MNTISDFVIERARAVPVDRSAEEGRLLERAAALQPEDRVLIELLLRGTSRRRIAEIVRQPAGTVTRRIQRVCRRLHDPLVIALLDQACPLSPELRQLGVEYFLHGLKAPELAEKHQMPVSRLRNMLWIVRGWHRGLSSGYRRLGFDSRR